MPALKQLPPRVFRALCALVALAALGWGTWSLWPNLERLTSGAPSCGYPSKETFAEDLARSEARLQTLQMTKFGQAHTD